MTKRKPVHAKYDAVVDFFPPGAMPELVYGLVKYTYDIVGDRCKLGAVEPLFHDIRQPDTKPLWLPGSDFWPTKLETDVAVRGDAYVPDGRPAQSLRLRVAVGARNKYVQVLGDRAVSWTARGNLRFGPATPFKKMPVVWSNAYGGWDPRVPVGEDPLTVGTMGRLEFDHPGMYPRNPFGRGYTVVDEPCEGLRLPNLEDPAQLLTPDNLVTGDPRRWYRQPLPACFDYTTAMMFHRLCWLGQEAWFHPPRTATLAEVELGVLPPDYHALISPLTAAPQVMQEAAIGLTFASLPADTPFVVENMNPERPRVAFTLPAPPALEFIVEKKLYPAAAQLTNVLIEPELPRVSLTYVARQAELPRVFVPGIHAKIPLALRIDGSQTIVYETPPTLRDLRKRGGA